ncbi:hypothetical protein AMK68_02185 [candidate division KD3-62 bacterium DG_56]|uniref:Uncharacterized protein n=1 Tax=candidate division KD3-62 bacterium DG_56 TaxID=1704032 RepID=A0A0S7XNT6_9BACT|nr:MAG: hypothetical protein AMK68_02185 [candidate division KD3-62 bacterium DG_56]
MLGEGKNSHGDAPSVFSATSDDQVAGSSDQRDVVATILARFGVDLTTIEAPLPGKPLTEGPVGAAAVGK